MTTQDVRDEWDEFTEHGDPAEVVAYAEQANMWDAVRDAEDMTYSQRLYWLLECPSDQLVRCEEVTA